MEQVDLENVWNVCFESILIINHEGQIKKANRSALRLFELSSKTLGETSVFELIPLEYQKFLMTTDEMTGISLSFGTKELLMNVLPFNDHFLLIIKDITQQQLLKYKLQQATEQKFLYDSILDMLEEGVCAINMEGEILFYNKKMGEIDLREPDSVKQKLFRETFPDIDEHSSILLKTLRLSKSLNYRETHFTNSGKAVTTLSKSKTLSIGTKQVGAVEILKDITEQKQLEETIRNFKSDPVRENTHTSKNKNNNTRFQFKDIVFTSRVMRQTVDQARRAARTSSSTFIIGDTGTGKELFAQSIHNDSPRKSFPFIAQNCAALPEHLLEGLLFGTSVGSFTGAIDREGLIEQAHGGTLLLDEINSMGISLQAKLLRFLQEKTIQRLGAKKSIDVDVRVIATINEDPYAAIENGRLREDLFYRLSVVNIIIQPLKKRKEDIPVLIDHFLQKHSERLQIRVDKVESEVMDIFLNYEWPGNIRELEHTIEGCINMLDGESTIAYHHLSATFQARTNEHAQITPVGHKIPKLSLSAGLSLEEQKDKLERTLIQLALEEENGNVTRAGKLLGISRQNLNYKLKKYSLT
ncbi:sigma 54-interacting transcriptional regulator [Bacillus norwichensis]|uniref:Sigma 54-interacting transcriptional regulator n=1 Tax=Bacillus norwichensis TaxID=2762217 RepID=A0ABR8VLB5_9BACI|nr:sigma 54-interacting transcriptional regulator [Bacillus norwichensis]MBD8005567.1 sigma 54-interacting transcriptional regulator [Bacillus norwichensis]